MDSELLLKFIGYLFDIVAYAFTLFWATFAKTAVYVHAFPKMDDFSSPRSKFLKCARNTNADSHEINSEVNLTYLNVMRW